LNLVENLTVTSIIQLLMGCSPGVNMLFTQFTVHNVWKTSTTSLLISLQYST